MVRTQIYLTEHEKTALGVLSAATGKAQSELIREAIDHFFAQNSPARRKAILGKRPACGRTAETCPILARCASSGIASKPT